MFRAGVSHLLPYCQLKRLCPHEWLQELRSGMPGPVLFLITALHAGAGIPALGSRTSDLDGGAVGQGSQDKW